MSFWSWLFGTDTTINVASTVYNLAGDETKRPNFLDTTMLGAVLSDSDLSICEQLNSAYLSGPGIQIRNFASWARVYGYDALVGISATPIALTSAIDVTVLGPLLPAVTGQTLVIQASQIGMADYTFWVTQFMFENYPTQLDTAFTCDFNAATKLVTISLVGGTVVTFTATTFDPAGQFLYVAYNYEIPGTPDIPATVGPPPTADIPAVPATWTQTTYMAYQKGTGNAGLDALFTTTSDAGYFMPYIPMIVKKTFISSTYMPDVYTQCVAATRKALGASYDDLVAKVTANPNVGDIDYAYIVFAVSLNVLENDCRNYIYQFFLDIMTGLDLSSTAFATWQTEWAAAAASMTAWATWQVAQSNTASPLYGTTAPVVIPYPASPGYSVNVASATDAVMNYNMTVSWSGLNETTGTGQLTNILGVPASTGEFWFQTVSNVMVNGSAWVNATVGALPTTQTRSHVRLNWQVDTNNWRCLDIYDLTHTNLIYGGQAVVTLAADALADAAESGFLIPLNEEIYARMSLVNSTQMATACCFIVFNQYTVTTTPWWDAGWFQILLILGGIVLSVVTGGAGAIGLLGSNIAVGTALGLTGVAAAILGAVVNALAAIVLMQIIQIGAKAILGPELGAIFGAIIGLVAMQIGTALASGMSPATLMNMMLQPANILKLTEAVGNGFAQVMQYNALQIENSTQTMLDQYNAADAQVEAQYALMFGAGGGADLSINPLSLIDVPLPNVTPSPFLAETPTSFFSRTLMVGSDVCDLSMGLVTDYCNLNTSTTLPGLT